MPQDKPSLIQQAVQKDLMGGLDTGFVFAVFPLPYRTFQNTIAHLPSPYQPVIAQQFLQYVFWPLVHTSHGWSGIPQPECFHKKHRYFTQMLH